MRIGVFLDAFADRPLEAALDWVTQALLDVKDVELGCGGYSPATHANARALAERPAGVQEVRSLVEERGLNIAALNVSGNPLHPDATVGPRHDRDLRDTIKLAAALEVDRVVTMSGCPGSSPMDSSPHFCGGGWLPDLEGIFEQQFTDVVAPYWTDLLSFAAEHHPDLRICLELHPGTWAYNTATFERMATLGDNLAINLDPSHFFWQSMDALAIVKHFPGQIGFAHGKDTKFIEEHLALNGVLDPRWPGVASEMPWNFATVGDTHDADWWARFAVVLAAAGHDGVISIEYEDPFLGPEESILRSTEVLATALDKAGLVGSR